MVIKIPRKLDPQHSFADTKSFIEDQDKYLITVVQNNITWTIFLQNENTKFHQNQYKANPDKTIDYDYQAYLLGCERW